MIQVHHTSLQITKGVHYLFVGLRNQGRPTKIMYGEKHTTTSWAFQLNSISEFEVLILFPENNHVNIYPLQ